MIASIIGLAFAAQVAVGPPLPGSDVPPVERVQYGVPAHPPPCGNGWDLSARDGMCYPNGYLPLQEQAGRIYGRGRYGGGGYYEGGPVYRGGGRYPVPCGGDGVDLDVRDGRCYPTGTVPRRYQNRPRYYDRY